jgi:hypothetical protein
MTNTRERGTHCQYIVAAIAVVGPSNDHRKPFSWQVQELLGCADSSP